jgi:hypothetical protein
MWKTIEDGSIEAIGAYFRPEDKGTKGNVDFKPKYMCTYI